MNPEFLVRSEMTVRQVMARIDASAKGVVLLVDDDERLLRTITDGDIRRGILAGIGLDSAVSTLRDLSGAADHAPVTAPAGADRAMQIELMRTHSVRQLPLIDDEGRVVELALLDDLIPSEPLRVHAVLMAGGLGTRLRPLTDDIPKPMLPVGGRPVMELIISRLRKAGIHRVSVTTHYRPEKIRDHFGDGGAFGIELSYINEAQPLGTAGALALLERRDEPMLVINGDILTDVNYRAMLEYHTENGADITVGIRHYELNVPYGVVDCEGPFVRDLKEKPVVGFFVNAGIYLLEPGVCDLIPRDGDRFDMTDLIHAVLAAGRKIAGFPICEYWIDIGQHEDYRRAQAHADPEEHSE